MSDQLYRCGWCGRPTDADGKAIQRDVADVEVANRINGECCPGGDAETVCEQRRQAARDQYQANERMFEENCRIFSAHYNRTKAIRQKEER